jgi:hypothetical protein
VADRFLLPFEQSQGSKPAVDGCVVGVRWPDLSVKLKELRMLAAVMGVDKAGERARRKSVYAVGGVIGVFISSSCLIRFTLRSNGLLGSSEGSIGASGDGVLS